jgi:hypothetical protein
MIAMRDNADNTFNSVIAFPKFFRVVSDRCLRFSKGMDDLTLA